MRTGELQAPVGYDRWSYAYRDIAGSKVHDSRREDRWGGEPFGPGDVVGFAIGLVDGGGGGGGGGNGAGGNSDGGVGGGILDTTNSGAGAGDRGAPRRP